jgi:hypothetical protein
MSTPVTAEAVFASHATALGLPAMLEQEELDVYVARVGKNDEGYRCLSLAVAAAKIADHAEVHNWLNQARQSIKNPFPPDRRNDR